MRPEAILTDFDRTLTGPHDARPMPAAMDALASARAAGLRIVIVSGRTLPSLVELVGDVADALVAENGAVLRFADGSVRALATTLPHVELGVDVERGTSIASVDVAHEPLMRAALEKAGVRATLIRNRDRVMALPEGVDKARGALEALRAFGIDPARAVAFGDGENDLVLLRAVGWGVAVANAVPELRGVANETTSEAGGAGVAAWIRARVLEVAA